MKKFKLNLTSFGAWKLYLPMLVLANASYFLTDFFGWAITLGFFLLVPGYLLLRLIDKEIVGRWMVISFSLGLSVLLLMLGGLALNSLHAFGLERPLTTWNIFIMLDVVAAVLILLERKLKLSLPTKFPRLRKEQTIVIVLLSLMPILAIGGAIRLNNGASNILTMIMFGGVAVLFMWLALKKELRPIYPYAVFVFGLAVLFSTSLRGWGITGHDIQHEFRVFQIAAKNGYWNIKSPKGDPYNACLSITILPTIIAKLTGISAPYVYKVVFQSIFAIGLVPIYLFIKKLSSQRIALTGALVFISFPPFFNDMPFLNRQEIAFVFFALLILISFMKIKSKTKTILTITMLLGVILSHYSSGYVALSILLLSFIVSKILPKIMANEIKYKLPILSLPIILCALLFTFLWNSQITSTTAGLKQTITQTVGGLWSGQSSQSSGVTYSLFSPPALKPSLILAKYARSKASSVTYATPANIPTTNLGLSISKIISPSALNDIFRSFCAKILQVLLVVGLMVMFFRNRRKATGRDMYVYSLIIACIILMVLITLLPALSVDYSVTRLFQQTLIITALPMIMAADYLLQFTRMFKLFLVSLLFSVVFLDLSGFVPQAFGGYPPQMALNNSGIYYDIYYVHSGEKRAALWLQSHDEYKRGIAADQYAAMRFSGFPFVKVNLTNPILISGNHHYLYLDYANVHQGLYASFLSGDVLEYSYTSPIEDGNRLYVNQASEIYYR